jgi:hypothetical protein
MKMGTWGPGLYSNDFAADLRPALAKLALLPFDQNKLLDCVIALEPSVATNPEGEDYTTFWLVVADQFAKKSVFNSKVKEIASGIIESGKDLKNLERLGASSAYLQKRAKSLIDLGARINAETKKLNSGIVLLKPEEFHLEAGGVYSYPTLNGEPINPYLSAKQIDKQPFLSNGTGLLLVIDRGRAFDHFVWYQVCTVIGYQTGLPEKETLIQKLKWQYAGTGCCSSKQIKKLNLEKVIQLDLSDKSVKKYFPYRNNGELTALADISIANKMTIHSTQVAQVYSDAFGKVRKQNLPLPPSLSQLLGSWPPSLFKN